MSQPDERDVARSVSGVGARSLIPLDGGPFYAAPTDVPGTPGTLLRTERAHFYLDPLRLVQAPARVTRMMFSSTDRHGEPIAVTGTVLSSTKRRSPEGRGLVVFAVGTQGMAAKCAASRQMAVGREYESVFIAGLLSRGFDVVVPDYQGHGVESHVHTYMSRVAQGHVVLDAARAARQVEGIALAQGPLALTGYSQGGGACASAAEQWLDYAPELDIVGAVAGASPADLYRTALFLDGGPYFAFLLYTVAGIVEDYGLDVSGLVNDRGAELLSTVRTECLFESLRAHAFSRFSQLTRDGSSLTEMMNDPVFETILREQRLGAPGRWPRMPTMLVHSRLDDVVPYECSRALAQRWVDQGARVRLVTGVAPGHIPAMATSYRSYAFLRARFAGKPVRANTSRYLRELAAAEVEVS